MNIFKILANGYATINETNISAFLGYLLDPNENHSLNTVFLGRFINEILTDEDFNINQYTYHIFYEQTFKGKNKDERVDIAILCSKIDKGNKSQNELTSFIDSSREIIKVFLIENKIKKNRVTKNQLLKQRKNAVEILGLSKVKDNDIHSIYLTPDLDEYKNEFNSFDGSLITHILWKSQNITERSTIINILKDILRDELVGEIEAIDDYTKQTIKSFIQFIDNDFKSEIQINKDKKDGLYQKDIHTTFESFQNKYFDILDEPSFRILKNFAIYLKQSNYDNLSYRFTKTHPISVFYKKKKIFGLHRKGKSLVYEVIYRNFKTIKDLDTELKEEFKVITYFDKNRLKGKRFKPNNLSNKEIKKIFTKIINKVKNL